MKIVFKVLVFALMFNGTYAQEIVFEKLYSELPFGLRVENSGIYSIASFDVEEDVYSFTSFNQAGIFQYYNGTINLKNIDPTNAKGLALEDVKTFDNDYSLLKKNYFTNFSILNDFNGTIAGTNNQQIIISVPDRNQLIITSAIPGIQNNISLDFSSDLACADFIGIDKNGNLFVEVQKYLNEIPIQIQRQVKIFSRKGELITTINLPSIKYLYTLKDLQIDENGNLYQLLSYRDKVQIIKWNSSIYNSSNQINFDEKFNIQIHYNNFVSTKEFEQPPIFSDDLNVGTSRRDALRIADTYTVHQYNCTSSNLAPNGTTAPDGDVVKTPAWLVVGTNARIPYKWGGFSTIAQFDAAMLINRYAGDINTDGVSSYAFGVDCSGYVSRCWQLSYHASTSYMPNITTQYVSWDNLKPGDAIHKVGHVRLFLKRNVNGSFKIIEASARNWDVSYWSYTASDLATYTPRYYNNMEVNYNSQTPVLLSANSDNQNQVTLDWECDSTDVLGYRIYGSTDGNNWNVLMDENSCTITYAKFSVSNSEKYFRISSIKNDPPNYSESYWSNVLGSIKNGSEKKVLIVDGFEREIGSWRGDGNQFVIKYGNALQLSFLDFMSVKTSELQNGLFHLEDFDFVFWILGDESTIDETFNSSEQQLVKNYLENGGNIFVSGSEIGWDLDNNGSASDKDFYNNYLKADYVSDDAGSNSVIGIPNSALDGCNFNIGQTYEEDYPDEIAPFGGSNSCIKYSNNKIGGIQFKGSFNNSANISSLIHLSFPLETTADNESFNSVITKSIYFFNSSQVSVEEVNTSVYNFSLDQNYPNPFNPSTKISWQSPVGSWQTIKLFNALGQEVDTIVDEYLPAGFHSKLYPNGINSTLPSGVYFYQLKAGDYIQTKKMIFLK